MSIIKKPFAILFAVLAVMLMNTSVFAMIEGLNEENPYVVTSGNGLISASKNSMEYYIRLDSDIEISEETGCIKPVYLKHVNLNGHTIKVTNSQFIFMYTNADATVKNYELYNGKIVIDVPKQSNSTPCMINSNIGHIKLRDITMDVTMRNDNSVVFYNEDSSGSVTNADLGLYNCTINDHSTVKTKIIKARPLLKMENTTVTCDNQNSYALVIMHDAKYFRMKNCKLKGKIGFDVYNPKTMDVNRYIENWKSETLGGSVIIGTEDSNGIQSVVYKEDIAYGDYVAETYPTFYSTPEAIDVECGQKLTAQASFCHADTCKWYLAQELGGKYTEITEDDWEQPIETTFDKVYGTSSLYCYEAGAWLDGYWICVEISDGVHQRTSPWVQININKATLSNITVYNLMPPTQGEPLDYEMNFSKSVTQCIENCSIGYFQDAHCQYPYINPQAGETCYIYIDIDLKSKYTELAKDENGGYTVDFKWVGLDEANVIQSFVMPSEDEFDVFYVYKVPVPNDGAGELLQRVYTGVTEPEAGKAPSTAAFNTGAYVPRGYSVQSVSWTPSDSTFVSGRYYTAVFTIKANPGYFIDDETEFYLNDTKVEPISITDSGTPGNTATVAITFAKRGDINADTLIDKADAALLLKHLTGAAPLTGVNLKCADMNIDNKYDMRDVIEILKAKTED